MSLPTVQRTFRLVCYCTLQREDTAHDVGADQLGPGATVYTRRAADGRGTVLAGTDAGLFRSRDIGATRSRLPVPADLTADALARDAAQRRIDAAPNQGLWRSADTGATWTHA
jgi:hypothetical protein